MASCLAARTATRRRDEPPPCSLRVSVVLYALPCLAYDLYVPLII